MSGGPAAALRAACNPSCFVKTCKKDRCAVSLAGAPQPRAIIDLDSAHSPLGPAQVRCDYLFVADGKKGSPGWFAPIEITAGQSKSAVRIRDQLQAGADVVAHLLPDNLQPKFVPVFAGKLKKHEQTELRKDACKVAFRGKRRLVRRIACGGRLAGAFRAAG